MLIYLTDSPDPTDNTFSQAIVDDLDQRHLWNCFVYLPTGSMTVRAPLQIALRTRKQTTPVLRVDIDRINDMHSVGDHRHPRSMHFHADQSFAPSTPRTVRFTIEITTVNNCRTFH